MVAETIKQLIDMDNTYIGDAPIKVDSCQWINTSSGNSDTYFGLDTYDKLNFGIYVRNKSNKKASSIMDNIYHKLKNYIGDGFVITVKRLPTYVGRDSNYRSIYSITVTYQLGGY